MDEASRIGKHKFQARYGDPKPYMNYENDLPYSAVIKSFHNPAATMDDFKNALHSYHSSFIAGHAVEAARKRGMWHGAGGLREHMSKHHPKRLEELEDIDYYGPGHDKPVHAGGDD